MDEVMKGIKSPSGLFKTQIIKRSKDGLFTSKIFMWFYHDKEISEVIGDDGYWGVLYSTTSITESVDRCMITAVEQLFVASGEKIIL